MSDLYEHARPRSLRNGLVLDNGLLCLEEIFSSRPVARFASSQQIAEIGATKVGSSRELGGATRAKSLRPLVCPSTILLESLLRGQVLDMVWTLHLIEDKVLPFAPDGGIPTSSPATWRIVVSLAEGRGGNTITEPSGK
jgi:hypothetical protein